MHRQYSLFFGDGRKTIDFILVYNANLLNDESSMKLEKFLDNLLRTGLDLEIDSFSADTTITFVKIHGTKSTIQHYADVCDIEFAYKSVKYRPKTKPMFRFMATPITLPNPEDPVYQRSPESVSGDLPTDMTTAEKILVIHEMLSRTKFGYRYAEFGIKKLLNDRILTEAFPIHEGSHKWTDSGPLTDRQLLAKYWGAPGCWYKEQPLNLIEKYFGAEVAFYFAWLGFYVRMLVPVAILSILCVLYGVFTIRTYQNKRSEEICNSNLIMCPRCDYKMCKYEKLSNSCLLSHLSYISDNSASIAFAIIISFWSTFFMELWDRKECVLQLQWNLTQLEYDASMRPEYIQNAVYYRYSTITGEKEPYTPSSIKIARYVCSAISVILLMALIMLVTFEIMVYRVTVNLLIRKRTTIESVSETGAVIAAATGSFMAAIFIIICKLINAKIAMRLTIMENHRTQYEFDNGYIYKTYALAFVTNYTAVFYLAFFKGKFYTYPGDLTTWTHLSAIGSDFCSATGCLVELSIQLCVIMLVKIFVNNYVQLILPRLVVLFQRRKNKIKDSDDLPAYEREYLMAPGDRYFLINEYMDMVIQYGFVVFFVAGFPLLPVFALINNFAELRIDSYNISRNMRRTVPNKVPGLGAWHGILQAVTYIGVVTNALVIAFTSDFVPRELYAYHVDNRLTGFVNSTISAFDVSEFEIKERERPDVCFYPGKRHPPDHPNKYQLTTDFWYTLAMRFLVVVIFEHVIMILKGILAYVIPDVPAYVSEQIASKERENKEIRMKVLNDTYMEERRRVGVRTSFVEPFALDENK